MLLRRFFVGLAVGSAFLSSGCATVAVLETVAETEIQLSKPQSELHKATAAFCETSRDSRWASGESNFSTLMKIWGGTNEIGEEYWTHLTAFEPTSSEIVEQVSFDVTRAAGHLNDVNALAQALLPSHGADRKPRNADVREFERVLIHAGQARETFAASFLKLKQTDRAALEDINPVEVLKPLDESLELARLIADGLAAARMSEVLALLEEPTS
ncbi:hypothetical protein [Hirschia maritima]|uniref:hypothetical protein n=1 Tax=Hirschia maritima TaxID=1121961 RepID=UPI00036A8B2D